MSDIFISYARENRDFAQRLAEVLTDTGWSVWWDREILPGKTFDEVIAQELENASCVVVLWSTEAAASLWVKDEATDAAQRGVLVPAKIDDVKVQLGFRRMHFADLTGWTGAQDDEEWMQFVAAIRNIASANPQATGTRAPNARRPAMANAPAGRRLSPMLVALLLIVTVTVGALAVMQLGGPKPVDAASDGGEPPRRVMTRSKTQASMTAAVKAVPAIKSRRRSRRSNRTARTPVRCWSSGR